MSLMKGRAGRSPVPLSEDPKRAQSKEEAVFIGQQATGDTVIIGKEDSEEWFISDNMVPLSAEECR